MTIRLPYSWAPAEFFQADTDRASNRNVPAVIRVTSTTVTVTAVNCTVTLKYIFALYVTLMNFRFTTTTTIQ